MNQYKVQKLNFDCLHDFYSLRKDDSLVCLYVVQIGGRFYMYKGFYYFPRHTDDDCRHILIKEKIIKYKFDFVSYDYVIAYMFRHYYRLLHAGYDVFNQTIEVLRDSY